MAAVVAALSASAAGLLAVGPSVVAPVAVFAEASASTRPRRRLSPPVGSPASIRTADSESPEDPEASLTPETSARARAGSASSTAPAASSVGSFDASYSWRTRSKSRSRARTTPVAGPEDLTDTLERNAPVLSGSEKRFHMGGRTYSVFFHDDLVNNEGWAGPMSGVGRKRPPPRKRGEKKKNEGDAADRGAKRRAGRKDTTPKKREAQEVTEKETKVKEGRAAPTFPSGTPSRPFHPRLDLSFFATNYRPDAPPKDEFYDLNKRLWHELEPTDLPGREMVRTVPRSLGFYEGDLVVRGVRWN